MKYLITAFLLTVIITGCNKDSNPVNSGNNNTVNDWVSIYSSTDIDSISNIDFYKFLKAVKTSDYNSIKYSYQHKSNKDFYLYINSYNSTYVNLVKRWNSSSADWVSVLDSNFINNSFDTLKLHIGNPGTGNFICVKNLSIFMKTNN